MNERRRLASMVLEGGQSLSHACRVFGVTRKTGRKWVERAKEQGLDGMQSLSQAPQRVANKTKPEHETRLLELHDEHRGDWKAKKLVDLMTNADIPTVSLRTANRILERHGRTTPRKLAAPMERFEREHPLELLQMDFKGLSRETPYSILSVIDDATRYGLALQAIPDKRGSTVFDTLWGMFEEYGLPLQILMDNGDCWGAPGSKAPTAFEARLMLLGIQPIHGRPRHPQTQGKVERFHRTLKCELGDQLMQPTMAAAQHELDWFLKRYNWVRPHDSLGGKTPGSRFAPSNRKRPATMPEHEIPHGAQSRKVDSEGFISFRGKEHKVGRGLTGHRVVIADTEAGLRLQFAGFDLALISEL